MNPEFRQHLQAGETAGMRYALQIPRDAMRGAVGYQLGHTAGASLDFKDYREYEPGDDLRRIDWGAYARSDKLIVKLYREEVSPHLDVLIDGSRSMHLDGVPKAEAALGVAGVLSAAAANARCTMATWLSQSNVVPVANGNQMASAWEGIVFDGRATPSEALHVMPPRWRRNGLRVLISDLLWEDDPLHFLRAFCDGAAAVIVVQVLTRDELKPTLQGNCRLYDVENQSHNEVYIDAVARRRYEEALQALRQHWHRACRQVGASMALVTAEQALGADLRLDALEEVGVLTTL